MKKNLFLTGKTRQGKSSLLRSILSPIIEDVGGFTVQRLQNGGKTWAFRLLDLSFHEYVPELESTEEFADIVIYYAGRGRWQPDLNVFNQKGTKALARAAQAGKKLILLDELGIFEEKAWTFRNKVIEILTGPVPVLGVIKDKPNPFLDSIRKRDDTKILRFEKNKREISAEIAKFLQEMGLYS